MCKVYALTQDQLRKANAPNAYGYVHKYLMQIKWSKADLPKLSAVAMHLKVYGRLTDESQEALTIPLRRIRSRALHYQFAGCHR